MLPPKFSKLLQIVFSWIVASVLLFQHDLCSSVFIMFAWLLPWIAAAALGALAVDAVIWRLKHRAGRHYIGALLLAIILGPSLPWTNIPFCWVSAAQKLVRSEAEYEKLVADVAAGLRPAAVYMIDVGPPLRIAFAWGGVADNWFGVVHDTSRSIGSAERDVLGGQLTRIMHLWGPWFYVEFT